jgi:hypothetical protein
MYAGRNPMQDSILLMAATVLFYFLAFPDQLGGLVAWLF